VPQGNHHGEEESRMDEKKKLSVVVEHWIEHNESHQGEYRKWAERAGVLGLNLVKAEIENAMEKLTQSNLHLERALKELSSFE
jgi:3-hydroxy-3-methylglutaryl CoA synthase